jgi:hypothetical protein
MLFDHRTYTCKPGTLPRHMALYEKHGLAAQQRHLGKPLFYGITETGLVNSFVHIWVYADAADRAEKRAAMQADPEWIEYLGMSAEAGNLVSQENKLMVEAPFFKLP